jgi:hypothetical protein
MHATPSIDEIGGAKLCAPSGGSIVALVLPERQYRTLAAGETDAIIWRTEGVAAIPSPGKKSRPRYND